MTKTSVVIKYPGELAMYVTIDHTFGESENQILERVFEGFNGGSPNEHPEFIRQRCRSLSVGDFVNVNDTWYCCESMGWRKCEMSEPDDFNRQVLSHPKFDEWGAWTCAQDLRWNKSQISQNGA